MKKATHTVLLVTVLTVVWLACAVPAGALERTVDQTSLFCLSTEDFTAIPEDDGIFLTSVPSRNIAVVRYGNRALKAGDALPKEALNQLTLDTDCVTKQDTSIGYYTISDGCVTGAKELKLSILPKKNDPPVAKDSTLETYKNIANTGMLQAENPSGGPLTFSLVKAPKRGTVEISEDGTFTYTPNQNKVGKDSFTFTVSDRNGNVSQEAKVTIEIKKPTDRAAYADMAGDPDAYKAMWLKDQGLFTGSTVGGNLCFGPEETVSRGEFLVMAMKLIGAEADDARRTSGFADEADTPRWMQPYIVSALQDGMITGVNSEQGLVFRPTAALTKAESVVLLQNMLHLPTSSTQTVFSSQEDSAIPAWAKDAADAMRTAGIPVGLSAAAEPITRRETAQILYHVQAVLDQMDKETFFWIQ